MRRLSTLAPLIAILAALTPPLPAQQPIVVRGRVVQAGDGSRLIRRVRIQLIESGSPAQTVFSDDRGAFEFRVSDSKPVTLSASKTAFLKTSLTVSARSAAEPIEIRLVKGSVLAGRVLDPMGSPIVGTAVRARLLGAPGSQTTSQPPSFAGFTNDLGEFRIFGLAPGRYELFTYRDFDEQQRLSGSDLSHEAMRAWLTRVPTTGAPQPLSDSVTVDVRAGEEQFVTLLHLEQARQLTGSPVDGVISGLVLDDYGDAAEDVKVRLWRAQFSGGQPLFAVQSGASSTVDDQGRYRLPAAPGKHFVEVVSSESPPPLAPLPRALYIRTGGQSSMPLGYYPAAARVDQASDVYVGPNQQVSGVNVTLHRPGPPIRISGTVVDGDGRPLQGTVSVIPIVGPSGIIVSRRATSSNPDGSFEFTNLSAGDYILRASRDEDLRRGARGLGATEFGWQRIWVSESASGPFRIQAPRTAHILGRITLESSKDIRAVSPSEFRFAAMSVDPVTAPDSTMAVNSPLEGLSIVEIAKDWTFDQHGFAAPSRVTLTHGPRGWWLKSVHAPTPQPAYEPIEPGGVLGGNVEITLVLSDTAATLSGRVLDAQRRSQTECIVVVFAVDQRRWFGGSPYVRLMMPQEASRFTIHSIPPGEYYVAAVQGRLWDVLPDPEVLLSLSASAQRVRLAEGDSVTTDVRLSLAP